MLQSGEALLVKPISEYAHVCEKATLEEFLSEDQAAVFIHCKILDPLRAVVGAPGETIDRLALERAPSIDPEGAFSPMLAYAVLPIESTDGPRTGEFLIGCGQGCDILLNDASISRAHAWIELRDGAFLLRDNASAAGTQVNDELLEVGEERKLRSGAKVSFGAVDLLFLGPAEFYHFVKRVLD